MTGSELWATKDCSDLYSASLLSWKARDTTALERGALAGASMKGGGGVK